MKTSELSGAALDWAVAKCENRNFKLIESFLDYYDEGEMRYSTDWAQGGPIIGKTNITIGPAHFSTSEYEAFTKYGNKALYGQTPLIAAMRCYVASILGDDVEIPKELTQ